MTTEIEGIRTSLESIKSLKNSVQGTESLAPAKPAGDEKDSFSSMLLNAVKEVDVLQHKADEQITGMMLGDKGVTPHNAMITLEKADIAFQMMNMVRGKIVRAYQQIMQTQL